MVWWITRVSRRRIAIERREMSFSSEWKPSTLQGIFSWHVLAPYKPFRHKQYAAAAESYRQGLLHAPGAKEPSADSEEAALLHGNLSATLTHQSKWHASAWECSLALRCHAAIGSTSASAPTPPRLQERLNLSCSKLGRGDISDYKECLNWLKKGYEVVEEVKEEECDRYGSVDLPVPRYGRHDEVRRVSNYMCRDPT